MKVAFIIDPISTINPEKDTSFALMLGCEANGHEIFSIQAENIEFLSGAVQAKSSLLEVQDTKENFIKISSENKSLLSDFDVIFIRKDPPFDDNYLYMTLLLDQIEQLENNKTRIINTPSSLRNCNEKMASHFLNKWTPETLISSNSDSIIDFLEEKKHIVAKPLDGHGGRGIFFLKPTDTDILKKVLELTKNQTERYLFQEYCKGAEIGDKRVLLVEGEPIGAILRVASEKGKLNNLDQGGKAIPTELTAVDLEICKDLKPFLKAQGIFFAGIDLLGDKLTEINVTSPTGLRELSRFSGVNWHEKIIENL